MAEARSARGRCRSGAYGDIQFTATGRIDAEVSPIPNGPLFDLTAGESFTMSDGSEINAQDGEVHVLADGDITLGSLVGDWYVSVFSRDGSILDGGDSAPDIVSETAELTAYRAGAVGTAANPLETQVDELSGASVAGFYVDNTGTVDIAYSGIDADGDVRIAVVGDLTVSATVRSGGTVTMRAPSGQIVVDAPVSAASGTGGEVVLIGSVVVNAALTPGAGTITLQAKPVTVAGVTPTRSGFVVEFSGPIQREGLNLYDGVGGTPGAADVLLQDSGGRVVVGSIVVDGGLLAMEFVKTGGVLPPDTYTLTLHSALGAFRDANDVPLDGNGDGTTGDDLVSQFTVAASADRIVSIPDFARGAGQAVNSPAAATGLPIRIDNGDLVTALSVEVVYRASLLEISAASLAAGLPGDWTLDSLNTRVEGATKVTTVTAHGTTPLAGSGVEVVRLTAAVPVGAAYGDSQAIRLENVLVNGGAIAATGDVAVHKAAYLGDADGSGIHSAADAFLVVQAALGLASGFAAHAWTDPRIVGDADGSGLLSAADAFLIVQEGLGLSEPFVPDNPHITVSPVGGGVDPQFRIDAAIPAVAGGWVTVPVMLAIEPAATNVGGIDFELFFDPTMLTIDVPSGVSWGADTSGGWGLSATLVAAGQLRVGLVGAGGQALVPGLREIARLRFRVADQTAASGRNAIPLAERAGRAGVSGLGEAGLRGNPRAERVGYGVLDIEPLDSRAGGYTWTDVDGSLVVLPVAEREQNVGVRTPAASGPRERLFGDWETKLSPLEELLDQLTPAITHPWRRDSA